MVGDRNTGEGCGADGMTLTWESCTYSFNDTTVLGFHLPSNRVKWPMSGDEKVSLLTAEQAPPFVYHCFLPFSVWCGKMYGPNFTS